MLLLLPAIGTGNLRSSAGCAGSLTGTAGYGSAVFPSAETLVASSSRRGFGFFLFFHGERGGRRRFFFLVCSSILPAGFVEKVRQCEELLHLVAFLSKKKKKTHPSFVHVFLFSFFSKLVHARLHATRMFIRNHHWEVGST